MRYRTVLLLVSPIMPAGCDPIPVQMSSQKQTQSSKPEDGPIKEQIRRQWK